MIYFMMNLLEETKQVITQTELSSPLGPLYIGKTWAIWDTRVIWEVDIYAKNSAATKRIFASY